MCCAIPCTKDRLSLLRVLLGGTNPTFRLNAFALELLPQLGVSQKWSAKLAAVLAYEQDFTEEQIDSCLPPLGPTLHKSVKDALAIAAYRSQTSYPVVQLLLCDDAPQFNWLTAELALCWIHEYRHYKKLVPRFTHHLDLLQDFGEHFWKLYQSLLDYRNHHSQTLAAAITTEFEQLFGKPCGYQQLDECKARTLAKKEALLKVLSHPEILAALQSSRVGCQATCP